MGRLIDADAFIEDIKTEIVNLALDGLKGTPRPREELYQIIDRINEQSTAYDVEEVERQIKDRFENYLDEIIDSPESLDKIDFLLKQNKEICNLVRNGGKE